MERHWSRRLKGGIGREIETKALNIENLEREKKGLIAKLESINREIQIQEYEILESINEEWSKEEINSARAIL